MTTQEDILLHLRDPEEVKDVEMPQAPLVPELPDPQPLTAGRLILKIVFIPREPNHILARHGTTGVY